MGRIGGGCSSVARCSTQAQGSMATACGSEKVGPQRSRNDKAGRRSWSPKEEEVLAEGMKKIVREGMKSENGFKTGFLAMLETYIRQHIPNCTLKADPHITSRITVWKRNYNTLFDILKHTEVGLDYESKMVEATDEQWEGFIKADSNARLMRNKSWPFYNSWCEIFGTTRATGEGAQEHNAAEPPPPNPSGENISCPINLDNLDEGQSENYSGHMGESSGLDKQTSGSKRKITPPHDPFIDVMKDFCTSASARLGEIAQMIGFEQDASVARQKIWEIVIGMDEMTHKEKLRVTQLIT